MTNTASRSYRAYRCGLEQPQGGADFQRAFSGAGFGMRGVETREWNGAPS